MGLVKLLQRLATIRNLLASGVIAAKDLRELVTDLRIALDDNRLDRDELARLAIDAVQLALDVAVAKTSG